MSHFVIKPPVHIPSGYKEYKISGNDLAKKYSDLGVEQPFPRSDVWYYHSDPEGWAKIVPFLIIKSSLYKEDKRDCDFYARKAYVMCCELFELNTLLYTYGSMPLGAHGFCSFWTGDAIMLLEPNEGYKDECGEYRDFWGVLDGDIVFGIGDNGYLPLKVLL